MLLFITKLKLCIFYSPLPEGRTIMCKIRRKNHELVNKLFPTYYLSLNSNNIFLLNAQKKTFIKASCYHISSVVDDFEDNESKGSKIAELRSDFFGLTWNLVSGFYTKGFTNDIDKQKDKENSRERFKENNKEKYIKVPKEKTEIGQIQDIYATILYVIIYQF